LEEAGEGKPPALVGLGELMRRLPPDRKKRIEQLKNLEQMNDLASRVRDLYDWINENAIDLMPTFEEMIFNADARRHHYLIVNKEDPEYPDDDKYEIIHDPDCGKVWHYAPGGGMNDYEEYTCAVQYQIDAIGYDDFKEGYPDLEPGKYEIKYVFNWSGSMFDDCEQYIEVGERIEE